MSLIEQNLAKQLIDLRYQQAQGIRHIRVPIDTAIDELQAHLDCQQQLRAAIGALSGVAAGEGAARPVHEVSCDCRDVSVPCGYGSTS